MQNMKYIMIDDGIKTPILFPPSLTHSDMAHRVGGEVLSAGFVQVGIRDGEVAVDAYGDSDSLKVKSDKEDSAIIRRFVLCDW